jgi:hypothetical protein
VNRWGIRRAYKKGTTGHLAFPFPCFYVPKVPHTGQFHENRRLTLKNKQKFGIFILFFLVLLGVRTSPFAFKNSRANPKSSMKILCWEESVRPTAKFDGLMSPFEGKIGLEKEKGKNYCGENQWNEFPWWIAEFVGQLEVPLTWKIVDSAIPYANLLLHSIPFSTN